MMKQKATQRAERRKQRRKREERRKKKKKYFNFNAVVVPKAALFLKWNFMSVIVDCGIPFHHRVAQKCFLALLGS